MKHWKAIDPEAYVPAELNMRAGMVWLESGDYDATRRLFNAALGELKAVESVWETTIDCHRLRNIIGASGEMPFADAAFLAEVHCKLQLAMADKGVVYEGGEI